MPRGLMCPLCGARFPAGAGRAAGDVCGNPAADGPDPQASVADRPCPGVLVPAPEGNAGPLEVERADPPESFSP